MRSIPMAFVILAACDPSNRPDGGTGPDAPPIPTGDAPPVADMSRVYAHSGGMLYRMDALTLAATPIGAMTGILPPQGGQTPASLLDLAVDRDDNLVGISRYELYSLSKTTGAATLVKSLKASAQGFTSLSYVPGTSASDPEMLVSANDQGDVFRIDPTTGDATKIGNYGTAPGGAQIKSSGDLFGVTGFGVWATVDVGEEEMDYLARVDPTNNWKATLVGQSTGYDKIFGLGFWGGKIYGFVDNGFDIGGGKMIQIDETNGSAIELSTADIRWFGAGVTTKAPIIE
ncbi:MAG: hypothetical protein SFX73_23015 [Kofleriaceae bacterium]|nr:hypothetical protein [Kofleriaceae bacterium]